MVMYVYYGPALDVDHSLSARDLSSALLYFADALEEAKNEIASDADVELRVEATREGSFDIQLIVQSLLDFAHSDIGQAVQYLAEIGLPAIFVEAVRFVTHRVKHGEPVKSEIVDAPSDSYFTEQHVKVTYPDGIVEEYTETSIRIGRNRKFTNNIGKAVLGPSGQDGVDGAELTVTGENMDSIDVNRDIATGLASWVPVEDVLEKQVTQMFVQPVDVHFSAGKKWRFTRGDKNEYAADMLDSDFIKKVDEGLRIGKNDTFYIEVEVTTTRQDNGKLKSTYKVLKVINFIPFDAQQNTLF